MAFVVGTHGEFKRGDDGFDPAVGPPRGEKVAHKSTPRGRLGAGVKQEVVREGAAGEREDGAVGGAGPGLIIKLAACATDVTRIGAQGLYLLQHHDHACCA